MILMLILTLFGIETSIKDTSNYKPPNGGISGNGWY
jgi:hypothetical protein